MQIRLLMIGLGLLTVAGRADPVEEIAALHVEAIGGPERVAEAKTLRMTGVVLTDGKRLKFMMIAARPAQVRLETEGDGRTLVHATNGRDTPWEIDSNVVPRQVRLMGPSAARAFSSDSEFDDPLIAGASRGFTLEYAGESQRDGQRFLRMLVTKGLTESFALLIDPDTYFIVRREDHVSTTEGHVRQVVSYYSDFRLTQGLLLPYHLKVTSDGEVEQEMFLHTIEINPHLPPDAFDAPKTGSDAKQR